MDDGSQPWQPELPASILPKPPDLPQDPMELLSRSWASAMAEDAAAELQAVELAEEGAAEVGGNPFAFAPSAMSQLVMERIMSQPHSEVSPLTSGRPSTSSGPLNGGQSCGSLSDSPPVSPSDLDDAKFSRASNTGKLHQRSKTVGRWLKDRKERKKEEARAHNAELHATVSVAAVAAAVAAIAAGTAAASSSSGKDGDRTAKTDLAMASAATLVAAHCVEAAEAMGAEREHLAAVISSAVSVRNPGDVITLTAAAATALRGAATLKARLLKEVWNAVAAIPVEESRADTGLTHRRSQQRKNSNKNGVPDGGVSSDELIPQEENIISVCSQELLARGTELLKRTRKGALHWKIISVYIHRTGNVMLKMKSRHVAGTITKMKKSVVTGVCKEVAAWPGRHLLEGGEQRQYFGLRTAERVIEFECGNQREYELWTQGVSRLLKIVAEKKRRPPTPCRRTIPGYSYSV